ncbi:hypothetical protein GCM10027082_18660 [Comamonas humi]
MKELDQLEKQCLSEGKRGNGQPIPVCVKMAAHVEELLDRGWCAGPSYLPTANQHWMRCMDDKPVDPRLVQLAQPQPSAKPKPAGVETVSIAQLKKMTVIGIEAFKPYRVSAMINALDLGTDGLCERLRYDGYCADGVERVYLNIDIDSSAQRSQLYDLRGKRGTAICATVVMHPRNVNGTMNLIGFTPGGCD